MSTILRIVGASFLILTGFACQPEPQGVAVRQAIAEPAPAGEPVSATRAVAGRDTASAATPIAAVNGVGVDRRDFVRLLVQAHGLPLLQRIILRDLARQEAKRAGIAVDRADIESEYDVTIREALGAGASGEWSGSQREKFIEELVRMR